MRGKDFIAFVAALATHAGIALALSHMPPPSDHKPTVVEMDVRKTAPPPPKITPPEPPKPLPPEPPRKIVQKVKIAPPPTATPPPNQEPPKEPPKDPPKPVFGVTMESTTEGDSSFAIPTGNTTMIDPSKSGKHDGKVAPLPAAPAGPAPYVYKPVSELYIKKLPEIDNEACAHSVSYPDEALQLGIEGPVKLRIELDEKGSIHSIKVLEGLGHGLDQVALEALKHHRECKFSAAEATDGKKAAYALTYTFRFELPR
jgi:TonB family protein